MRLRAAAGTDVLAAGGAGVLLALLHVIGRDLPVVREGAWLLLVGGGAAGIIIGLRRHRPADDRPWRVLALGFILLTLGNLVRFPLWEGPTVATISQLLELVAFPMLGLAALGMVRRQTPHGDKEGAVDGALIMVALLTVLAGTVFSPDTLQATGLLGQILITVAPLILAFVCAMGARLLFVGNLVPSTNLLIFASASAFTGHVLRVFSQSQGVYSRGSYEDLFIAAAYLSVGLGALHPSMATLTLPVPPTDGRLSRSRLTVLGVCLLVPPVTILVTGTATVVSMTASVVVAALVLLRLWRLVLEREAVRDDMRHQAIHDALTGLPNRTEVLSRLERALNRAGTTNLSAVLFIDLDGFKRVNDDYGHRVGDATLIAVVRRLQELCRSEDMLGRLSGDEFVLVCEDLEERAVLALADRVVSAFAIPFVLPDATVSLGASVGVALHAGPEGDPEQLLSEADAAMYQSKQSGGGGVAVYGVDLGARLLRRRRLELDLAGAAAAGQLRLVYQPMIGLRDGRDVRAQDVTTVGVEALLRWDHPELGAIAPAELIPIADASGLIVGVGQWVFAEAVSQLRRWLDADVVPDGFRLFVNVSPRQLVDAALPERLCRLVDDHGVDRGALVLEITETAVLDDAGPAVRTLEALSAVGFQIALDDFGTGYSSLTHLKQLPLDLIKIDATFVEDLTSSPDDQAIVGAIVSIARQLDVRVVGEGVEAPDQRALLERLGCDIAQGYHLGHPVGATEVFGTAGPGDEQGPADGGAPCGHPRPVTAGGG